MSRKEAGAPGQPRPRRVIADNRRARFEFEILEQHEAGIILTGSEVKSLRGGACVLGDAHVAVRGGEAWLLNCHVAPYSHAGYAQHEPMRPRKLLLHRAEVERIARAVQVKGLTVVPLRIYFSGSRVKVELALARGKKLHDKRETIRKREQDRQARRGSD